MIRRYAVTLIVTCAVASAAVTAWAQDAPEAGMPAKMALTIPEAIELAWRNNIRSIQNQNSLRLSEARRLGARSTYMPSLSLGASWSQSSPTQAAFINDRLVDLKNFYQYSFRLSQPLFNGFRYIHEPRARTADLRGSEQSLRSTRQQLALEAKRACYDLLKAQMLADVQKRAVQRSEEQLETSQARYELGSASMSDFLKSKVQLGNDSLLLITRENDVEINRAKLNDFLGLPVERRTEIDAMLEFEPYPLPSAAARESAVASHPDVLQAGYARTSAAHEVGSASSARYPSLSATASYSYSTALWPDGFDEVWANDNASFGLSLNYTIFSGYSTTAQVRQAKIRRHTSEADLAQAHRTVKLAITTAALRVDEARKRYNVSEQQVRSAQEDLNIAQEKYNLGAATILDILNAQVSLSQAETDKIQAVFDYNLAVAELEKAMGGGD